MVFLKKSTFSSSVLLSKESKKETFFDILDSKECFLDLKSEVLKNSKKSAFCKRVSLWFLSKNRPFSYMFFLGKKAKNKHFLILWIENKAFWTSKVKFSQSRKKATFCKGVSSWFLTKNRRFSYMFFMSKKSQKETYFHILGSKECFLDLKSEVLAMSINRYFAKGLVHGFCQKIDLFLIFLFWKKSQKEAFSDILDSKEYFLDLKSEVLAK